MRVWFSPATTWALVTMRLSPATNPVPSWTRSQAWPSTSTVERVTRSAASAGIPSDGGVPASGDDSVSNTSGNDWSPTRRPSVSDSDGGDGASRSMTARDRAVAYGAGRPSRRAGERGDEQPDQHEHAGDAEHRAGDPVALAQAGSGVAPQAGVERRAGRGADRLGDGRHHDDERQRRQEPGAGRRTAQRVGDVGDEQDPDHDAEREPGPRRGAPHEPQAVPDPAGAGGDGEDDEIEEVHAPGASRRAWVRKPVWATMRWSGRTDWPSTCQVRCSTSSDSTMPNARIGQLLAQARHLPDGREVREQDAARVQRRLRVLHDPPRLGEIEEDAVEVVGADAVVDVAHLDVERHVGRRGSPRRWLRARRAKSSRIS